MKPLTAAFVCALVVALAVVGYLYYQRTNNDITIHLPKVEIKPSELGQKELLIGIAGPFIGYYVAMIVARSSSLMAFSIGVAVVVSG